MHFIGLDLGKRQDHTAMVAIDKVKDKCMLTGIKLYPLGTNYNEIANDVLDTLEKLPHSWYLYIDATGGGNAFVDLIEEIYYKREKQNGIIHSVFITPGSKYEEKGSEIYVSKPYLIESLAIAFETKQILFSEEMSKKREFTELLNQMANFQREITKAGNVRYEPVEGHDDILLAASYAWLGAKSYVEPILERL